MKHFILGVCAFVLTVFSSLHVKTALSQIPSPEHQNLPPQEIIQGWEYYWSDLSGSETDNTDRVKEILNSSGWQRFKFPQKLEKPPQYGDMATLWLRVSLPKGKWESPALYLKAVPNILSVYLGDQLIYEFYSLDVIGASYIEDYQWPIVRIDKEEVENNILLFKVYVDEPSIYIGWFDRITIGSNTALVKRLFWQESDFILGIFFTFLGLTAILLSCNRPEINSYLFFGLLTINIGIYTIFRSIFITFFIRDVTLIQYVTGISFYLMPISACIFFEKIFDAGDRLLIRRLWQISLAYAVITLPLIVGQIIYWSQAIQIARIFLLVSALVIAITAMNKSRNGDRDAKLFMTGFIILSLSAVNDLLIYWFEFSGWHQKLYPWGMFSFILILGFILEHRFAQARQRLQAYALELEHKNADLQHLNKLKDEFLANTSHELKTPLNGIIGIANSLIDGVTGKLPQQTVSNLAMIVASGRRLNQLVNDLLDFSQLKQKKIELNIKPIAIQEIASLVLGMSRSLVGNKAIQLVNNISPDTPPVEADEDRVQQILYNLIGNAIKFTETGTITLCTRIIPQVERLAITITDTGIGIPEDKLERIFEPFKQSDSSIARKYGGTGLGLALTKKLVELHGGTLSVESTVGVGSRFTFTLPLSDTEVAGESRQEISRVEECFPERVMPDEELISDLVLTPSKDIPKILVVDDEPVNLQVLVNYLSHHNYAIAKASSGMEALELMQTGFMPDLILLDVMMPQMSGYELCQQIRELYPPNELPVVLLTAKNQVSDLVEGFGAGANDYLTKPFWEKELLTRIKTHIQLAKINVAYGRFVPHEFLKFLERESIVDVQLGDQVQKDMTVLFADIRSFTTLSERMSPKENFDFLNACLSQVSPVIRKHHGFIDKYIGDAIMALFPQTTDDAVRAAIEMQQQVNHYNIYRQEQGEQPISIGIGIHTGSLMLGTVGESQRMETTVIADAVNLASRLEGLTKIYGVGILISLQTLKHLSNSHHYHTRCLGSAKVKGKSEAVDVFEVCDSDPPSLRELKLQTLAEFEQGVALYAQQNYSEAQQIFQQVLHRNPQDWAALYYVECCKKAKRLGISEFNGVIS